MTQAPTVDTMSMQKCVAEFHKKHGFPMDREFSTESAGPDADGRVAGRLGHLAATLGRLASAVEEEAVYLQGRGDARLYRAHLLIEELAEFCTGLAKRDEVAVADAVADIAYVTAGVAVTFGWDFSKLFQEVHESNMTKAVRSAGNERMRSKGPDYRPPRIKEILNGEL